MEVKSDIYIDINNQCIDSFDSVIEELKENITELIFKVIPEGIVKVWFNSTGKEMNRKLYQAKEIKLPVDIEIGNTYLACYFSSIQFMGSSWKDEFHPRGCIEFKVKNNDEMEGL